MGKNFGKYFFYFLLLFTLVGCSNDGTENSKKEDPDVEDDQQTSTIDGDNEGESNEEEQAQGPESIVPSNSCDGIVLKKDEIIDGKQLSKCLMDTMLVAKTATYKLESSDGSNGLVDVQWDPLFSANFYSNDQQIIIKDNEGWIHNPEVGWVKESDPSVSSEEVAYQNAIKLARGVMSPEGITQYFAFVNNWKVIDKETVPDNETFIQTAWHLVPTEDPYSLDGITISDSHLYLADNFLIAYYVNSASVAGFTARNSNAFTGWGGEIEIPEPGM